MKPTLNPGGLSNGDSPVEGTSQEGRGEGTSQEGRGEGTSDAERHP